MGTGPRYTAIVVHGVSASGPEHEERVPDRTHGKHRFSPGGREARPAVALDGDGAMRMNAVSELITAAEYRCS